jgi:hypothetical protein
MCNFLHSFSIGKNGNITFAPEKARNAGGMSACPIHSCKAWP